MTRNGKKILLLLSLLGFFLLFASKVSAAVCSSDAIYACGSDTNCLTTVSNQCSQDYENARSQSNTLRNQIAQFNAQINLTILKIADTQSKIELLGGRIGQLEISLNDLTKAFSSRAIETYKLSRFENNFMFLLTASDINDAVSRFHYLKRIQEEDQSLLEKLQEAQTTYKGQKTDQETLQAQLESQKVLLDRQKKDKANLLAITQNNEAIFARLRDEAAAELAVVSGFGTETFMRDVNTGDTIGNIISGRSGCSTGRHLHFEVHQGGSVVDPNSFLSNTSYSYSYSDMGYYGSIHPSGPWPWPINEPIIINQGYGATGYARGTYPNKFHQGIDMDSGSSTQVKAVHSGKLYGGSYNCTGALSGALLYTKVDNGDGTTVWYLHMIPQ